MPTTNICKHLVTLPMGASEKAASVRDGPDRRKKWRNFGKDPDDIPDGKTSRFFKGCFVNLFQMTLVIWLTELQIFFYMDRAKGRTDYILWKDADPTFYAKKVPNFRKHPLWWRPGALRELSSLKSACTKTNKKSTVFNLKKNRTIPYLE